jgi:hypothetical protein
MKKLLLIVVLLFSLNSYAQSVIQTFAAQIGYWNEYTEKYNWESAVKANITFTIQNGYIFSTDKNNSVYEIVKLESSTKTEGIWSATDEEGGECAVIIKYNEDDDNIFVIVYDTFCVKYYFE